MISQSNFWDLKLFELECIVSTYIFYLMKYCFVTTEKLALRGHYNICTSQNCNEIFVLRSKISFSLVFCSSILRKHIVEVYRSLRIVLYRLLKVFKPKKRSFNVVFVGGKMSSCISDTFTRQ